ncbi:MAG: HD domain-containing protein [Chloroflexi bacterium]|nr:HD domain-containing protein [Chloroflexota bacterium]
MILDIYEPDPAWFTRNPCGTHGIGHVARVLVWADLLCQDMAKRGNSFDPEVVRWAAVLHDLGRQNDGPDPEHGARSAEWIAANHRLLPVVLTEGQLQAIQYCCTWHVPRDACAPVMTTELAYLKDADGLDRVRIHDLDPDLLRTDYARSLEQSSWELFNATGREIPVDPWGVVRGAALEMGLWR